MTGPVWSAAELAVQPLDRYDPRVGVVVRAPRHAAVLPPELCRSLRDWLSWWLRDGGDSPPPADPDAVRAVVDQARSALRERSLQACSEDHRTGLAWCDHWLDRIAKAAAEHPGRPR